MPLPFGSRIKDKVILVTASTRGIGLAIVKKCAEEGAQVYMAARNMDRAQEIAGTLNGVKCVYNDAVKPETFSSMVEEVVTNAYNMFGTPSSITDAKGTVTTQSIDVFGRQDVISVANTSEVDYNYNGSLLDKITRTGTVDGQSLSQAYSFDYDAFGNMTSVTAGSYTLASYTYGAKNGPLAKQTYGNGATVSFVYDNLGRNKTTTYSGGRTLTYAYTGDGQLYSINDNTLGKYVYTYDTLGRLIASQRFNTSGGFVLGTNQTYNANNQLVGQSWKIGTAAFTESYSYNTSDGSLASMTSAAGTTLAYNYDYLRRLSSVNAGIFTRSYTYKDLSSTQTTTQVSRVSYSGLPSNPSYSYTYDALGNIATYTAPDGEVITYTYDNQGQLLKAVGDTTYTYTYDGFGNIKTANGHKYTYGNTGWRDLLTAYDGQRITYDASGNPTSYYNGTRWTFGWAEGRNLVSASGGGNTITYSYDHNGVRTGKTVVTETYHAHSYSSVVTAPTCTTGGYTTYTCTACGYSYTGDTTSTMGHDYSASTSGTTTTYTCTRCGDTYTETSGHAHSYTSTVVEPTCTEAGYTLQECACGYSTTTTYYYITNLQGDVMQLVNSSGTAVATYEYDPYGNIVSATGDLAEINPLRYRGYYYDSETELYYLQSRYYDPQVGRFINADALVSTGQGVLGNNIFAYCLNNPVGMLDTAGLAASYACYRDDPFEEFFRQLGGGGGGAAAAATAGAVTGMVIGMVAVVATSASKEKEDTKAEAIAITASSKPSANYYGADKYGGEWKIVTPAMNYDDAIAWVYSTAALHTYGRKASWGLYTANEVDALNIAVALGGAIPVQHTEGIGIYPHYHVAGMILFGQYKHFHLWYGEIMVGD